MADTMHSTKYKGNTAKPVFGDPALCAQFLKGYVDQEIFKNVTPDDIEDISEHFLPLNQDERNADTVMKIRVQEEYLAFLVILLEHQPKADYTICMKILRYFAFVWTYYEEEMEQLSPGSTKRSDFRLPPIVPVIYYEGNGRRTAAAQFPDIILKSDAFAKYIPNLTYEVVTLRDYENNPLIANEDEISLLMLFNKMLTCKDFLEMKELPQPYLDTLQNKTPAYLLQLIGKVVSVFLHKLKIPQKEAGTTTNRIIGGEFQPNRWN